MIPATDEARDNPSEARVGPASSASTPLTVGPVALKLESGLIVTMPRPHRHGSLKNRVREPHEDGFLLSDGSFADRKRAYEVAEAAGQIAHPHAAGSLYKPYSLFSEHLWAFTEEELSL